MELVAAGIAGAAVLLLVVGVFGARGHSVVGRLDQYGAPAAQLTRETPKAERPGLGQLVTGSAPVLALNRVVERRTWGDDMARNLARADLALKPAEYIALRAAAIVGAVAVTALLGATFLPGLANPLALVSAGIAGFIVPRQLVARRQGKRLKAFNDGLADTITLIANALRSGSSFLQSVEYVVRETQPPISTEFNRVIREVNLGLPFPQALSNMVRRVRSDDLDLMVTAIAIHHSVGGNLAEILDTISFTIRERVRIKGEIRTLTAQQRLSGYVVGFLPVALLGVLTIIAPNFITPMFVTPPEVLGIPLGVILLAFGGILMAIGFLAIRKIVDIEI